MTSEPSEDAINEFVLITNVTRDKAIAFLKVRLAEELFWRLPFV